MNDSMLSALSVVPFRWLPPAVRLRVVAMRLRQLTRSLELLEHEMDRATSATESFAAAYQRVETPDDTRNTPNHAQSRR